MLSRARNFPARAVRKVDLRIVAVKTRVVIIQHVLELSQRSNTGRHAATVVPTLDVRTYGAKEERLRVDDLAGAYLLWPEGTSAPTPPPSTLVVLDASWSQARHMIQRVPELLRLPRLSLTAPEGRRSLRQAPPGGMSTLESIAHAIELLEGADVAKPIHEAHEALVQKQLRERGYVGPMR